MPVEAERLTHAATGSMGLRQPDAFRPGMRLAAMLESSWAINSVAPRA